MIQELLYTSYEGEGLRKGGGGGFCSVLSTEGMAPNLATMLEKLSGYKHPFDMHDPRSANNPINYRHLIRRIGGANLHVLSRIADVRTEHTGRTNKLAHHVALTTDALPLGGPSWTLSHPGFCREAWDGKVALVAPKSESALPQTDIPIGPCKNWQTHAGDAGWAGVVAEHLLNQKSNPISIIFPSSCKPLLLVNEVFSLLPHAARWDVTFSTYFTTLPAGTTCALRMLLDGTTEAEKLRRDYRQTTIDLAAKLEPPANTPLVDAARTGQIEHPTPNPRGPSAAAERKRRAVPPLRRNPARFEPTTVDDAIAASADDPFAQEPTQHVVPANRARRPLRNVATAQVPRAETPFSSIYVKLLLAASVLMMTFILLLMTGVGAYFLGSQTSEMAAVPDRDDDPSVDNRLPKAHRDPDASVAPTVPEDDKSKPPKGKLNPPTDGASHSPGQDPMPSADGDNSPDPNSKQPPESGKSDPAVPPKGNPKPSNGKSGKPAPPKQTPLPKGSLPISQLALPGDISSSGPSEIQVLVKNIGPPDAVDFEVLGHGDFGLDDWGVLYDNESGVVAIWNFGDSKKNVAKFFIEKNNLCFQWTYDFAGTESNPEDLLRDIRLANSLRWCTLKVSRGDQTTLSALANPRKISASDLFAFALRDTLETAAPAYHCLTLNSSVKTKSKRLKLSKDDGHTASEAVYLVRVDPSSLPLPAVEKNEEAPEKSPPPPPPAMPAARCSFELSEDGDPSAIFVRRGTEVLIPHLVRTQMSEQWMQVSDPRSVQAVRRTLERVESYLASQFFPNQKQPTSQQILQHIRHQLVPKDELYRPAWQWIVARYTMHEVAREPSEFHFDLAGFSVVYDSPRAKNPTTLLIVE